MVDLRELRNIFKRIVKALEQYVNVLDKKRILIVKQKHKLIKAQLSLETSIKYYEEKK